MDNKTTIEEMKEQVKKFCEDRDWNQFHSPKELAIGMSTEANELLSLFRFKTEDDMKQILASAKRQDIEDEIGDILFFVCRFAQMYGIDLSTAYKNKLEKSGRKYPVEKVKGLNKKYNEYDNNGDCENAQ